MSRQEINSSFLEVLGTLSLEGVAVTATVDPVGKLGKIGGLWDKLGKQTIDLAHRGLLHTVVVADEQNDVLEAYLHEYAEPLRVLKASTVDEASLPLRAFLQDVKRKCSFLELIGRRKKVPIEMLYQELPLLWKVKRETLPRFEREGDEWNESNEDATNRTELLRWEEEMLREQVTYERYKLEKLFTDFQGVAKEEAQSHIPRFVALGPPGSGKTTLLQYLAWQAARGELRVAVATPLSVDRLRGRKLIPVQVRLRDWERWAVKSSHHELSLPEYLAELHEDIKPAPTVEQWRRWLQRGDALLLLDGLDEIAGEEELFATALTNALRLFSNCPTVLSCRTVSFEQHQTLCPELPVFTLAGLSDNQRDKYIHAFPAEHPDRFDPEALIAQLNRTHQMRPLAQNPLLLSIICYVVDDPWGVQLPATRTQLYDRAVSKLLQQFQLRRRVPVRYPYEEPDFDGKRAILEQVALTLLAHAEERALTFTGRQLDAALKEALTAAGYGKATAPWANALRKDLLQNSGILRGDAYRRFFFLHLTIHEFLTACALAQTAEEQGWEAIASFVDRKARLPTWQEVIVFLAGKLPDKHRERLLALLTDETKDDLFSSMLILAGGCVSQTIGLSGAKRRIETLRNKRRNLRHSPTRQLEQVEDAIIKRLVTARLEDHPRIDHSALEYVLASLGDKAAELLVHALLACIEEAPLEKEEIEEQALTEMVIINVLGIIGRKQDIEPLITLSQSEYGPRYTAIKALGNLGDDERVVEALLALLRNEDRLIRHSAAKALGQIGSDDERVIQALLFGLQDEDGSARGEIAKALGIIGGDNENVTGLLIRALEDENWRTRFSAVQALGEIGNEDAIPPLQRALKEADEYLVRHGAIEALGKIGNSGERVINTLIKALQEDQHKSVRYVAAKVLGEFGNALAIELLISVSQDKYEDKLVREGAITALGKFDDEKAIASLLSVLRDVNEEQYIRACALKAFALKKGEESIDLLTAALRSEYDDFSRFTVSALSEINSEKGIELLIEASRQPFYIPRRRDAIKALGKKGDERAIEPLIATLLDEENVVLREAAIEALGEIGDETAVEPIYSTLCELYSTVRNQGRDVRMARIPLAGEWEESRNEELIKAGFKALRKISKRHQLRIFPDGRMEKIKKVQRVTKQNDSEGREGFVKSFLRSTLRLTRRIVRKD